MRLALIDLGTNSVRFDVHQVGSGKKARRLYREKFMIRLGQGVFSGGKLESGAIKRTVQAFVSFKQTCNQLHVQEIIAFGTSALREASDRERLISQVRRRTGIEIKVISGEQEALLIAQGILRNEKKAKGKFALVDIGGGSTEVTVCQGKKIIASASFDLGTARLQQLFLKRSPPKEDSIERMREFIFDIVKGRIKSGHWPKVPRIIASSGTARALTRIGKDSDMSVRALSRGRLGDLVDEMCKMSTTQLMGLPGMEPRRVDMILAGAILMEEILHAFSAKTMVTTEFSLRDGMLSEAVRQNSKGSKDSFLIADVEQKAQRLGAPMTHVRQVKNLSRTLFEKLKKIHRLKPEWLVYLEAAALMHDVGESVSHAHHDQHSYYIVKNAEFRQMQPWETEFIARLCMQHQGGKVDRKQLPFKKDRRKVDAYIKLLALLRVADALDRSHRAYVVIKSVRMKRGLVELRVQGRNRAPIDLDLLRVEQKKDLFEEVFKRELKVF